MKVQILVCLILITGCSTLMAPSKNSEGYQMDATFKPRLMNSEGQTFEMKFLLPKDRVEVQRIYSNSKTRTVTSNQLRTEREEVVDFSVRSTVKNIDKNSGDRTVHIETLSKEGPVDLYDLGYPEPGEVLEYVYTTKAKVKKAGHFPDNSLFFIPPIALAEKSVAVGDTWIFSTNWVSLRNGLPMGVEVLSILKNIFDCGNKHKCAEIELSGTIQLPEALHKQAKIESLIAGRVLYNLDVGSIVWSDIRNREKLKTDDGEMEIISCTETLLESPQRDKWPWRAVVKCDPNGQLPTTVPGHVL